MRWTRQSIPSFPTPVGEGPFRFEAETWLTPYIGERPVPDEGEEEKSEPPLYLGEARLFECYRYNLEKVEKLKKNPQR